MRIICSTYLEIVMLFLSMDARDYQITAMGNTYRHIVVEFDTRLNTVPQRKNKT